MIVVMDACQLLDHVSSGSADIAQSPEAAALARRAWTVRVPHLSSPADDAFVDELARLNFDCGYPNWDGSGAAAIRNDAFDAGRAFLSLLPESFPMPELGVAPTGEFVLEWFGGSGNRFALMFEDARRVHFSGIFNGASINGTEPDRRRLDELLTNSLRRIYGWQFD